MVGDSFALISTVYYIVLHRCRVSLIFLVFGTLELFRDSLRRLSPSVEMRNQETTDYILSNIPRDDALAQDKGSKGPENLCQECRVRGIYWVRDGGEGR